jgi:hypothetical protein
VPAAENEELHRHTARNESALPTAPKFIAETADPCRAYARSEHADPILMKFVTDAHDDSLANDRIDTAEPCWRKPNVLKALANRVTLRMLILEPN